MAKFDLERLLSLSYVDRAGDVLAAFGAVEPTQWAAIAQSVTVDEPALVGIGDRHWALELWHSLDLGLSPSLQPIADAYLARWGGQIPTPLLYLCDLVSAYCDLVTDGVIRAADLINVTCSARHPLFVAAVIAQCEGLPLYTVVGVDRDKRLSRYKQTGKDLPSDWALLAPYLSRGNVSDTLKDVLSVECDPEDAEDALLDLLDSEDYLLHPVSAEAYYASTLYREEAESRNPIVTVAPFHPYLAARDLCLWVCEKAPKDLEQALRTLELETGWEIPPQLADRDTAESIINSIKNKYGETV